MNQAQDSKSLWETEVKSKSALGIRVNHIFYIFTRFIFALHADS